MFILYAIVSVMFSFAFWYNSFRFSRLFVHLSPVELKIHSVFFFLNLFFSRPGRSDAQAQRVNTPIEVQENASLELLIFCSVLPAWMAITEGGATPQKVPSANVCSGTPITGDARLMNQLGRIGVMRRNSI